MCQSMVNIQSPTAESRRGKKEEEERRRKIERKKERTNDRMKIHMVCPITQGDHKKLQVTTVTMATYINDSVERTEDLRFHVDRVP